MNSICKRATYNIVKLELAELYGHIQRSPLIWLAIATTLAGCPQAGIKDAYIDAVEHNANPQTNIYTKVAGLPFTVDILIGAVMNDNSIDLSPSNTYFDGNTNVDLVDCKNFNCSSDPCGSVGDSHAVTTASAYNWNGSEHGRLAYNFTSTKAVANAKVRIYAYGCYPGYPCQSDTRCSTDTFTIRPNNFTVSSTPASGNNQAAGTNFSMTATAVNSSGTVTTSYTGTPVINSGVITDWTGASLPASSWSGVFSAATNGAAAGSSFKYSDFGPLNFPANAVYDNTYVSSSGSGDVANGECISGSSSNALSSGKYGCNVGASAFTTPSFVADHYEVSHTLTPACGTFTYLGQPFNSLAVTISAKNSSGNLLTRLTTGAPNKPTFTVSAANGGGAITPNPLSLNSFSWPANGVSGGVYANVTSGNTTTRPATPADYETFALKTTPDDGKSVTLCNGSSQALTYCSSPTTILRYGILKLSDGIGTALLPANMQVTAQYWNGSAFVTNTEDSCTPVQFNSNTIARGNYTGNLTGINLLNSAVTLANGIGVLQVSSVGQKTGSAKIAIRLAATDNNCLGVAAPGPSGALNSLSYLGGIWCGASYSMDTSAQASFGTVKSPYIYRSEKF